MNKLNGTEITERIIYLSKQAHETRESLASLIGKNKQVFTDWKNRNILPSCADVYILAKHFGVPMEYILLGEENTIPNEIAATCALLMNLDEVQRNSMISLIHNQVEFWQKEKKTIENK